MPENAEAQNTEQNAEGASSQNVDPSKLSGEQLSEALKNMGGDPSNSETTSTGDEGKDKGSQSPSPEGGDKTGEMIEALKAEIEKLNQRLVKKDEFIGHQSAEVGELRKRLKEQSVEGRREFKERILEDPEGAMEARERAIQAEAQIQQLDASEREGVARQFITGKFPDFDKMVPEIAEIALEDGEPPELVELFKRHPYQVDPAHLANYARRVIARRSIKDYESKLTTLNQQIESIKKGDAGVIDRINQAARSTVVPAGGGSGGPSSAPGDLTEARISQMSDAELKAELAKRLGR